MSLNVVNTPIEKGVTRCTSDYKTRGKRKTHNGMDLIGNSRNIIAIANGVVASTGYGLKAGYYVYIKHENGYMSFFCHLKKGSILVKKGQSVVKKKKIATMDKSGIATGVHLHFAVKNSKGNWIDPKPYLEGDENFAKKVVDSSLPKTGTYTIISDRNVYTSHSNKSTRKLVKDLTPSGKAHATSKKSTAKATLKKGTKVTVSKVVKNDEGHIWGYIPSGWICIISNDGTKHIK